MSEGTSFMGKPEQYLGDGVYASFDGYQIWLHTLRGEGWHRIALDPSVFNALVDYAKALKEKKA